MMHHPTTVSLAVCALSVLLLAQDTQPDFAAELQKLRRAYDEAEQNFYAPLTKAKTPEERKQVKLDNDKHPRKEYLPQFEELAKRAAGTEIALDACTLVLQIQTSGAGRKELALRLLREYPDSPKLEQIVTHVAYASTEQEIAQQLAALSKSSPHRKVQAAALMASAGSEVSHGTFNAEQKQGLERVVKDYADTRYAKEAERALRVHEHYAVGRKAPDFEGTGVNGETIKLSQLLGKVVLIDFWGYW